MAAQGQLERLQALGRQMPVLDAAAAQRAAAAQGTQAAAALAAVPAGAGVRQAQALAPAATLQAGQQQLAAEKASAQSQLELAQAGQQAQALQQAVGAGQAARGQRETLTGEARAAQAALGAAERQQRQDLTETELAMQRRVQDAGLAYDNEAAFLDRREREQLAALGRDVRQQLFDARLTFERDQAGLKFSNATQLADYAVASARSEDAANDRLQQIQQGYDMRLALTNRAYEVLTGQLERQAQEAKAKNDNASLERIAEIRRGLAEERARLEHDAAWQSMRIQAVATVATVGLKAMGAP